MGHLCVISKCLQSLVKPSLSTGTPNTGSPEFAKLEILNEKSNEAL